MREQSGLKLVPRASFMPWGNPLRSLFSIKYKFQENPHKELVSFGFWQKWNYMGIDTKVMIWIPTKGRL